MPYLYEMLEPGTSRDAVARGPADQGEPPPRDSSSSSSSEND